ncbi:L,D-transpeptidase [Paenibacillus doosanensis]|uniref:L,D-transpeptidase family protein n=1 Tax=Paenibacillus doosanensis TaxID=1229154 RepID=UPI0021802D02|nr:L,D-transpeptidase [Paenibacillus doosanensis]MCS7460129.1 L,D-transpeptidase [Paenibacillus doosanensis]
MKPKDHDEQLRQFFQHHPLDDPLYLKKYVREHPQNKMAWYLLGREYDAQGKRGKALYCYTQAGEIYEAFENRTIAVSPESERSLTLWERRGKRNKLLGRLRLAGLTLLLLLGVVFAPQWGSETRQSQQAYTLPPDMTADQVQQTKVYYVTGDKSKERVGAALQQMLLQERLNRYAILAYGKPAAGGDWISWLTPPDILLSVAARQDASQQQIEYHDAESCGCQPTDPAKPQAVYRAWSQQREQELVLNSALQAYERKYGEAADSLADLSRPYPDNVLSGATPFMEQLYQERKGQAAQAAAASAPVLADAEASASDASSAGDEGVGTGGLVKPLSEPLSIVVDKSNHRLALVSGRFIVRIYPVGLGAGRTPEGTFEISEKVRNPNGKSNGEFGSRGMTLSDTQYAIHGTNKPSSIGKDQSLGCVRMLKEDIEELFAMAPLGTPVTIGHGLLPTEIKRGQPPFGLPVSSEETNPGKVYKWLD